LRSRGGLLLIGLIAVSAHAQDARGWLDQMAQAVEKLNYEGTFVHMRDGNAETLHITHRNENGKIGERIISLGGAGREIIREQDQVKCILPDQKTVLLEQRTDVSPLVSALPTYSEDLEPHYEFALLKGSRVADRNTRLLAIKPKDEYRYGYMLWLDRETAMPLRSQLLDEEGRIVEQLLFTEIRIPDSIPASAIDPTTDVQGFEWLISPLEKPDVEAEVPWRAKDVPGGFKLSAATQALIGGSQYPVDHLIYTDGLASVSVFIEDPKTKSEVTDGYSGSGGTNTFSLRLGGRQITAVGEVPRKTVHSIASSLIAE
jgi:sigma-E factor negative regulatory protein RseB